MLFVRLWSWRDRKRIVSYLFTSPSLANEVEWISARHVIPLGPVSSNLSTIFAPTIIVWFTCIPGGVRYAWPVTPLELPFDSLVVESKPKALAAVFSDRRSDERLLLGVSDAHQVRRHSQASGTRTVPALFGRSLEFVARSAMRHPAMWATWQWHGKLLNYVRTKKHHQAVKTHQMANNDLPNSRAAWSSTWQEVKKKMK